MNINKLSDNQLMELYKTKNEAAKMQDKNNQTKTVATFSEDGLEAIKSIAQRLEEAETLEAAKVLVVELRELLPKEETKEEGVKETTPEASAEEATDGKDTPVTEKVEEKPATEEVKPVEVEKVEEPATEGAEVPAKETVEGEPKPEQLSEALKLNSELIETLKGANGKIEQLETLNKELDTKLADKDSVIEQYQVKDEQIKVEAFNLELDKVTEEWCTVMNVPKDRVNSVREMLSTFGNVDKLENVRNQLAVKANTVMETEPTYFTQPSSVLKETNALTVEEFKELSPKDRTELLFEQFKELSK